jgi:anti-sigma B factor antagonist
MSQTEKLELTSASHNDIEIIHLQGYLDAHTALKLEDFIQKLIDLKKYKFIFDFSELEYISSAGLGVFMEFVEEIRDNGGDLKFSSMQDNVFSVFDLLGFPMLFDITDNNELAIDKFQAQN